MLFLDTIPRDSISWYFSMGSPQSFAHIYTAGMVYVKGCRQPAKIIKLSWWPKRPKCGSRFIVVQYIYNTFWCWTKSIKPWQIRYMYKLNNFDVLILGVWCTKWTWPTFSSVPSYCEICFKLIRWGSVETLKIQYIVQYNVQYNVRPNISRPEACMAILSSSAAQCSISWYTS